MILTELHLSLFLLHFILHSHPCLLILSIVPAITGLGYQQGNHVALSEAKQRAVVTGSMGEDGLDTSSSVFLQTCCHGAGPGQRAGLCCGDEEEEEDSCYHTAINFSFCYKALNDAWNIQNVYRDFIQCRFLYYSHFCEIFSSESIFTQKCTVLLWFYYHISFYSHLLWPLSY